MAIMGEGGRERERYKVPYGARLNFKEGDSVETGEVVAQWDPYTSPDSHRHHRYGQVRRLIQKM
jgi:DNA-directed RNA polymerase subunit beta'